MEGVGFMKKISGVNRHSHLTNFEDKVRLTGKLVRKIRSCAHRGNSST